MPVTTGIERTYIRPAEQVYTLNLTRAQLLLRWPRNVAHVEFLLSSGGIFNVIYITINHIVPITIFFELHFCRRRYRSNFNYYCDLIGLKATEFGEKNAK